MNVAPIDLSGLARAVPGSGIFLAFSAKRQPRSGARSQRFTNSRPIRGHIRCAEWGVSRAIAPHSTADQPKEPFGLDVAVGPKSARACARRGPRTRCCRRAVLTHHFRRTETWASIPVSRAGIRYPGDFLRKSWLESRCKTCRWRCTGESRWVDRQCRCY